MIGFFQGKTGFPNQNKEDAVVDALLPALDNDRCKFFEFRAAHDVDVHHRPDIFIGENTDTLNGF
ncbi:MULTISPECIES: hypothetical protein [unclassified Acinetobacter]|uniref:hypothetical protein n=1 Tax=unclassified Acinetobacter TaxID=196816 RepID=UPI0003A479A5|nr:MULTISPECIES: hypothetical protein [unclassified Acinetobacter]TCB81893.1 hypothetical protein E0H90_14520 [Acinetobacter sp. ANC 3791]